MEFKIQTTPALEEHGGPAEDHPDALFNDLNYAGVDAVWIYLGGRFAVAWERDALDDALAEFSVRHGRRLAPSQALSDPSLSYGKVYFQERGANVMHVEYESRYIRGEEVTSEMYPRPDSEIENALREWLERTHDEVVAIVAGRAGEMRG
jgi:hypothetical protein